MPPLQMDNLLGRWFVSSSKRETVTTHAVGTLPPGMATEIIKLKEIGLLIAEKDKLDAGMYDIVVEYKMGGSQLSIEDVPIPAMAVTFSGIGLRKSSAEGPLTINFKPKRKKAASS